MRERPILFTPDNARAILERRKTQTRRLMKPQPWRVWGCGVRHGEAVVSAHVRYQQGEADVWVACRYGAPGDRLWVREAHALVPATAYRGSTGVQQAINPEEPSEAAVYKAGWDRSPPARWRHAMHMPRWASRLILEIVAVRVERLQVISEADARAEGCGRAVDEDDIDGAPDAPAPAQTYRGGYRWLWDEINGRGSWDANPYVWVVEFRRVEG